MGRERGSRQRMLVPRNVEGVCMFVELEELQMCYTTGGEYAQFIAEFHV